MFEAIHRSVDDSIELLSNAEVVSDMLSDGRICGFVSVPGTYFGAAVVSDYITHENYDSITVISAIISAILYFLLSLGSILQAIRLLRLVKASGWRSIYLIKSFSLGITFIFSFCTFHP